MSHIAVASKVARGEADVGLGNNHASCRSGFYPIATRALTWSYGGRFAQSPFQALVEVINSESYRQEVEGMGGYDVSQMGNIIED